MKLVTAAAPQITSLPDDSAARFWVVVVVVVVVYQPILDPTASAGRFEQPNDGEEPQKRRHNKAEQRRGEFPRRQG